MKKTTGILALVMVVALTACKNDLSFKKTKGGMPYKVFPSKEGKPLKVGEFVKVHVIRKINDSVTFDSHGKMALISPVDSVGTPYDASEIMSKLKVGDSLVAVQLIDTFMKRYPGQVPPQYKKRRPPFYYLQHSGCFAGKSFNGRLSKRKKQSPGR